MRQSLLVLTCLLALTPQAQSIYNQNSPIVVHYEKTPQGYYQFYCDNSSLCPYTVTVNFPELNNMQADVMLPAVVEVRPGSHRILTLKKTSTIFSFSFAYSWAKGGLHTKADTSIAYLLPVAPGKETNISELSWIPANFAGESKPKDFYVIAVRMHSGDTVYTTRRGRVIDTRSNANLADTGIYYNEDENFIEVLHDDGTFGRYNAFRDNSLFVHPGDWVEAGQPLGIVGGDKYLAGPHVQFSVRYHFEQPILDKDNQPTGKTQYWAYVPINFWVRGTGRTHLDNRTTYTSEHPADLVVKEMSKKEARKWAEAHPNSSMLTH